VVSIERIEELASTAKKVLNRLGCKNVKVHSSVVTLGWPKDAPYDAIIVTAGAPHVPEILLSQLRLGGRMVIPVGSRWEQDLLMVTKRKRKHLVTNLGGCRFVPLIGHEAWEE
jgi:protein-L-isoaspartate(D-aspartate) O-methyltransferase